MVDHIVIALAIEVGLALLLRNWVAGAAASCAWSICREITQAEYRWIEHFGSGLRANMPWWGGFDPRVWQRADPWLDWIVPVAAAIAVAFVATRIGGIKTRRRRR